MKESNREKKERRVKERAEKRKIKKTKINRKELIENKKTLRQGEKNKQRIEGRQGDNQRLLISEKRKKKKKSRKRNGMKERSN